MLMGQTDEFYRDLDKFSSSEEEGEEENSVMLDEGMNNVDQIQAKFKRLEVRSSACTHLTLT